MRPLIKNQNTLAFLSDSNIGIGDIILYLHNNHNYIHRLIFKTKKNFVITDDTGVIGLKKISDIKILGKISKPFWWRVLFCGFNGLIFCLLSNFIFRIGRKFKYFLNW